MKGYIDLLKLCLHLPCKYIFLKFFFFKIHRKIKNYIILTNFSSVIYQNHWILNPTFLCKVHKVDQNDYKFKDSLVLIHIEPNTITIS